MNTETKIKISDKVCPTVLIDDTPSEVDLLAKNNEIGPHERIANTLMDIICSNTEKGGKMIGLEGGWGSGKSSVIRILNKLLESKTNITIFSFDAWAHEGDPLRRTYLESLIRHFLSLDGWLNKEKWNNTLKQLAHKKKTTSIIKHQKSTLLGKIFAGSLLFVPLGTPFLTQALTGGISFNFDLNISWTFIIGFIFTMMPMIVLICNGLRIKFISTNTETSTSNWAFLTGDSTETIDENTSESPEPTSIEFEDFFKKLMREALNKDINRKAVIVIDNLDRVSPHDALSIWSTLQTFLQERNGDTEEWFNNLWVVVPYDPQGLRKIWDTTGQSNIDTSSLVSESFIDKSFQLRFEVPPLVLTNWKSYLYELIKIALPRHPESDRHSIYRVLSTCNSTLETPTPRELKTYINQIGAIHRQWSDFYPLNDVAYYVVLKRNGRDIKNELLHGTIPDLKAIPVLSNRVKLNLSGLLFNVDPDIGQQILLSDSMYTYLKDGEHEEISNLKDIHKEGFWTVLEDVMTSRLLNVPKEVLVSASICIKNSSILNNVDSHEKNAILKSLTDSSKNIKNWFPLTSNISDGISIICELSNNIKTSSALTDAIRSNLRTEINKSDNEYDATETVKNLVGIFNNISRMSHNEALKSKFCVAKNIEGWLKVCPAIVEEDERWWGKFSCFFNSVYIIRELNTLITNQEIDSSLLDAVKITSHAYIDCKWSSLIKNLGSIISADKPWETIKSNAVLSTLLYLHKSNSDDVNTLMKNLAQQGDLFDGLHHAQANKATECNAIYAAFILDALPNLNVSRQVRNSAAGIQYLNNILATDDPSFSRELIKRLSQIGGFASLYNIIEQRPSIDILILRSLRDIADGDNPEKFFTTEFVMDHWDDVILDLDESSGDGNTGLDRFDKLIIHLSENSNFVEDVVQATSNKFDNKYTDIYLSISKLSPTNEFLSWCSSSIDEISTSAWTEALKQDGLLLELLNALINKKVLVQLKTSFQDSLYEYVKEVIDGEIEPSEMIQKSKDNLFNALDEDNVVVVRRKIRDYAINKGAACSDAFFMYFGDEISHKEVLTQEFSILTKLFSPLIESESKEGLKWLVGVFENNNSILSKYKDRASRNDFVARVQSVVNKICPDTDVNKIIIKIASIIGVHKKESKTDE